MLFLYVLDNPLTLVQKINGKYKILACLSDVNANIATVEKNSKNLRLIKLEEKNCNFNLQVPENFKILGCGSRKNKKAANAFRILGTGVYGVYTCIDMPDVKIYEPKKMLRLTEPVYLLFEWVSTETNNYISTGIAHKNLLEVWNIILSLENLKKSGLKKIDDVLDERILADMRENWVQFYNDASISIGEMWPFYKNGKIQDKFCIPAPITTLLSSLGYDAIVCDGTENNICIVLP